MSTIFPREEKAEQIFDEILKNPHACERLKDTFFEAIPSAFLDFIITSLPSFLNQYFPCNNVTAFFDEFCSPLWYTSCSIFLLKSKKAEPAPLKLCLSLFSFYTAVILLLFSHKRSHRQELSYPLSWS